MGLFGNKEKYNAQATAEMAAAQKKTPEAKYAAARSNLLLVVAFSLLNLVLLLVGADLYFLFSATFPQIAVSVGQVFAAELQMPAFFVVGIVLAVISVGLYTLCWLFSKKNFGWMIAATILFGLDCLLLLAFLDVNMIVDIAFHVWVMFCLVSGCIAGGKKHGVVETAPAEVPGNPVELPTEPAEPAVLVNGEPIDTTKTYEE